MIAAVQFLPESIPLWLAIALATAATLAWIALRVWLPRELKLPYFLAAFVVRAAVAVLALWLIFSCVSVYVSFETPWGIGLLSLAGGVAIELALALYQFERRTLGPKSSVAVVVLRTILILLVLTLLAEPTLVKTNTYQEQRFVAVLLDESASMDLVDGQISSTEALDVARLFVPELPENPLDPQKTTATLRAASDKLHRLQVDTAKDPKSIQGEASVKVQASLKECLGEVAAIPKAITALRTDKLSADAVNNLKKISDSLARDAAPKEVAAADLPKAIDAACASVDAALREFSPLEDVVNQAYLNSLGEFKRRQVDEAVKKTRYAIALGALNREDKDGKPLEVLGKKYTVLTYRFATEATQAALTGEEKRDAALPSLQSTNMVAALEKVRADVPAGELSGILIISDGRHTANVSVDTEKQWLLQQRVPVCSVLVGSRRQPVDAAVVSVAAPQMVFLGSRVPMQAEIRLDGLDGKEVQVELVRGGKTLAQKKVKALGREMHEKVELGDQPDKAGLADYEVRVVPVEGETSTQNNVQEVHVQVSEDVTKLLLIDERPRWESRYIRNLFADRDKSVRLQYLLFRPDMIEGITPPQVAASANRAAGDVEANLPPVSEEEWMQFDVIVLGDVPPERLDAKTQAILDKFVREHGGRLIISSGINYMPHGYGKPLTDMLPVTVAPVKGQAPSPDPKYSIALTPSGDQHMVLRMDDDSAMSRKIWESFTEPYWWHHPVTSVKPGAEILAFAMPIPAPAIFGKNPPAQDAAELAKKRDEFVRSHALIVVQQYGAGAVMFLGLDSTYRLRYWTGDTYHHRFWGQMMRWATSDKLPVGNKLVRFGASNPVYPTAQPIKLGARFKDTAGKVTPVNEAWVTVYQNQTQVVRRKLEPVKDSGGMYQTELEPMKPGRYRAVLDIVDGEHADIVKAGKGLESQFIVSAAGSPETAQLSADATPLEEFAQVGGGVVVPPDRLAETFERFRQGSHERKDEIKNYLWQWWPLFVMIVCVVTAEWLVRKKGGLT